MGRKFREWKDSRPPWDRRKRTFRRYRQAKHKIQSEWKKGKKFMQTTNSLPCHLRIDFSTWAKILKKIYSEMEMKGYTGDMRNFRKENTNA